MKRFRISYLIPVNYFRSSSWIINVINLYAHNYKLVDIIRILFKCNLIFHFCLSTLFFSCHSKLLNYPTSYICTPPSHVLLLFIRLIMSLQFNSWIEKSGLDPQFGYLIPKEYKPKHFNKAPIVRCLSNLIGKL